MILLEELALAVLLVGAGLFILGMVASGVLAILLWIRGSARPDYLSWAFVVPLGAALVGAVSHMIFEARLRRAKYADADVSVGTVDSLEVVQRTDNEGALETIYTVDLHAVLADGVVLRRRIIGDLDGKAPSEVRKCRTLRFRHNTVEPDELDDVQFDGWA